jgi:hypothetical protein
VPVVDLHSDIEPYSYGMLDVGDGNAMYWETCGNPRGKPAVVLHGGPGSGRGESSRRFYDSDVYRIVLLDQRNCGRSTPHVGDPATDLSNNTTAKLIADIESLRTAPISASTAGSFSAAPGAARWRSPTPRHIRLTCPRSSSSASRPAGTPSGIGRSAEASPASSPSSAT